MSGASPGWYPDPTDAGRWRWYGPAPTGPADATRQVVLTLSGVA